MHRTAMHRMGLESLVQRGKSPFYTDLVSLYQESLDAVNELPNPSHGDVLLALKSVRFKERIKGLIASHMGVRLKRVVVDESNFPNLMCMMQQTPDTIKRRKNLDASPGMMLEEINRIYNDKNAYLNYNDKTAELPFEFTLYLYTSLWRIRNTDGTPLFTAEEVCAAILHELGHVDHYIRASFRVYGRTIDASEVIDYIQANPNREVILKLLDSLKYSFKDNRDFATILKITDEYFRKNNSMDDLYYKEALTTLCAMVVAGESAAQLFMFNNLLGGGRDRVATRVQEVDAERSADEFASRNGAYAPLNSMLGKLYEVSENKNHLLLRQFLWSGPAVFFGMLTHFTSIFRLSAEEVHHGYDPLIRRMELNVETAKHAFHDANLPDDVKAEIHGQIVQGEQYIAQYKSATYRKIRAEFKQWKDKVSKFGRIFGAPFQNRLSEDYERLQNATRSLSRHPLYYLADKR